MDKINLIRDLYAGNPLNLPSRFTRVLAVFYRHFRVYISNIGNYFTPIFEPIAFFIAFKYGFAPYLGQIGNNLSYVEYIIPGIVMNIVMWTVSFECTFETFVRLKYARIYLPMVSTNVSVFDAMFGEIIFAGVKGFVFSLIFLIEIFVWGHFNSFYSIFIPFFSFIVGMFFGGLGFIVVSIVNSMQTINFYISGVVVTLSLFSGAFFPIEGDFIFIDNLLAYLPTSYMLSVFRSLYFGSFEISFLINFLVVLSFTSLAVYFGVTRMKKRILA